MHRAPLIVVRRFARNIPMYVIDPVIAIHFAGEVIPIKRRQYGSGAVASRDSIEPFEMKRAFLVRNSGA